MKSATKVLLFSLLIHGEADDNDGTFPIQSNRMYQAVRGNCGIVRLVFLPHEAHRRSELNRRFASAPATL